MKPRFLVAGKCLRHERKSRNVSVRKLAELANINPYDLTQIETGLIRPSVDIAVRLCNALDLGLSVRGRLADCWKKPDEEKLQRWFEFVTRIKDPKNFGYPPHPDRLKAKATGQGELL